MKNIAFAVALGAVASVFAADAAAKTETEKKDAKPAAELQEKDDSAPLIWGFGNYGIYSGYQLYGSLVNSEPTLQGYLEVNFNLNFIDDWDFGYLGVGCWSNTDLTDKRRASYGKWFNEWDPNVHWGKTFWFDDDKTWGLDYRTTVVWYYYPHHRNSSFSHGHSAKTDTTMDWNHSFALINPWVVPFLDWVHEYHENNADLLQFGVRRDFKVCDKLTLTPSAAFVYRDHRYNWCFPTAGFTEFHNGSVATMKYELDATYQITDHIGLFAKIAWCSVIDKDLRDAADHGSGADYGQYKDFAWGGAGISVNF